MNISKSLSILFYTIVMLMFIFTSSLFIIKNIPGYGGFCDAEHFYVLITWIIFFFSALLIALKAYSLSYGEGQRKKFKPAFPLVCVTIVLVFSLKQIILISLYGHEYLILKSFEKGIELRLYENRKFFIQSYDSSCEKEYTGTYKIVEDQLHLMSGTDLKYIGTNYELKNDSAYCKNCEWPLSLAIQKDE